MKTNLGLLVLNTTLAGVMTVFVVGCNKPSDTTAAPPPSTTVGTEIDDSVVTTRVKSALLADPDIKSFDLKIETRKGEVQLSGFVDSAQSVSKAGEVARNIENVVSVKNDLIVK